MKTLVLAAAIFIGAIGLHAQTAASYPRLGVQWHQPLGYVPSSSTAVTKVDTILNFAHLANTSGGTVSVTMTDSTTNCGGSPCQFWPAITIAANTTYEVTFGGLVVPSGLKWSASSGATIVGWMTGYYTSSSITELIPGGTPYGDIVAGLISMRERQQSASLPLQVFPPAN